MRKKRDHHKEWLATKARLAIRKATLIKKLGGKCDNPDNNPNCTPYDNLEFNHLQGKTWEPRDMSPQQRMKQYEIEAEHGLINVRCKSCNSKDGALNKHYYSEIRHSIEEEVPF